jgi:hypothetical protein
MTAADGMLVPTDRFIVALHLLYCLFNAPANNKKARLTAACTSWWSHVSDSSRLGHNAFDYWQSPWKSALDWTLPPISVYGMTHNGELDLCRSLLAKCLICDSSWFRLDSLAIEPDWASHTPSSRFLGSGRFDVLPLSTIHHVSMRVGLLTL